MGDPLQEIQKSCQRYAQENAKVLDQLAGVRAKLAAKREELTASQLENRQLKSQIQATREASRLVTQVASLRAQEFRQDNQQVVAHCQALVARHSQLDQEIRANETLILGLAAHLKVQLGVLSGMPSKHL